MNTQSIMLLLIVIAISITFINAEKVSGTVNVADHAGFAFLGKFCFQDIPEPESEIKEEWPASGTIDFKLTNTDKTDASGYSLVLYDDRDSSWPAMHTKDVKQGLSCHAKTSEGFPTITKEIDSLKQNQPWSANIEIRQHWRPRWWRVYLVNCGVQKGDDELTDIEYYIHFKQVDHHKLMIEVGSNDQGLNAMYGTYFGIFFILFGLQLYAYYLYTTQQYHAHQVIKLLSTTIGLELFSVMFHFVDWITFSKSGRHHSFCIIMAMLCEIFASSVFSLLLLVLAQGWTISHFRVMHPKLLSGSIVVMATIQFVLYLWSLFSLDQEETVYIYNSTPERIYGSLFIAFGVIFVVLCVHSYRNEEAVPKKRFYILLCLVFSIWFAWPLIRISAGDAWRPWHRDLFIKSFSMTIKCAGYAAMMLLLCPIWSRKFFNLSVDQAASLKQSMSMSQSVAQLL